MHVVDLDGGSETTRIALRRRFEDTSGTHGSETEESVAG